MLIDFHTHAFPDKLAPHALESLSHAIHLTPATDGTIGGLIKRMDDDGVNYSVVCNIATNPKQTVNVNNFALDILRDHSDRIIPLGSVNPYFDEPEHELDRLADGGIKGIKIHPDYMHCMIDAPEFDRIFEICADHGMFIVTHAGFDVYSTEKIWCAPDGVLERIRRSPKTKLICAHYGGNTLWNEVEEKLIGKNIYIDTSLATVYDLPPAQAVRMLTGHDPEKILFGTDCPWCNARETFAYVNSLDISRALKEKIFSENAKKLLGMQ